MTSRLTHAVVFLTQLLLSAFFLFVGGMKAAAPMAMLRLHHAWVAGLGVAVARLVGASEVLCAAILLSGLAFTRARSFANVAAWALLANQVVALAFHIARGESAASAPQNLLIMLALLLVAMSRRGRASRWVAAPERRFGQR